MIFENLVLDFQEMELRGSEVLNLVLRDSQESFLGCVTVLKLFTASLGLFHPSCVVRADKFFHLLVVCGSFRC